MRPLESEKAALQRATETCREAIVWLRFSMAVQAVTFVGFSVLLWWRG